MSVVPVPVMDPPPLALAQQALELVGRDPAGALAAADEAVRTAHAARDGSARAVALRARCLAQRELGRVEEATAAGRTAVQAAVRVGDRALEAEARMSLAFVLLERGSVTAALHQADRAAHGVQGLAAARLTTQRALILQRSGHRDEALAGYARALPTLRRHADQVWQARLHNNRGLLHAYHGSLRDAETDLQNARRLYQDAGADVLAAGSLWNLGFVAARRGDAPSALQRYDAAAEIYERHGVPILELLLDRGELLLVVGATGEARRTADRAVGQLRTSALGLHLPEALLLLAQATIADGHPAEARASAREAARLFAAQGRSTWAVLARYVTVRAEERSGRFSARLLDEALAVADELARARWRVHELDVRLTAARVALARGDAKVAAEQLRTASAARSAAPLAVRMRAWYAEALLRLEAGQTAAAERALRAGMDLLVRERATIGATELRVHVAGHGRDVASLGLQLALDSGSARRVIGWAERWRAGALRLRPVLPPREDELAETLADLRRASAEAEEARLDGEAALHPQARVRALETRVRAHARQAAGVGGPWSAASAAVPDARMLADALGPACLVELVQVDDRLAAVTVAGRCRLHHLGSAGEVAAEADALAFAVRRLAVGPPPAMAARARDAAALAARELDLRLLAPLRRDLGDGPVVIVPTGALQSVPWSLLDTLAGREVTIAPSATVWHTAAVTPRRAMASAVVAVAGPRLVAADREVAEVASVRGAQSFTGAAATADAVLQAMRSADTVHIAAHGRLRVDNPLLSSLELADGPLTVYDLEHLPAAPRLVLLPACQSGLSSVHPGDEVMGLAQALLSLGSVAVVATVVPVADEATRPLMVEMHRQLAEGLSPAAALAAAQAAHDPEDPRSVAAAAGFVCFGAG